MCKWHYRDQTVSCYCGWRPQSHSPLITMSPRPSPLICIVKLNPYLFTCGQVLVFPELGAALFGLQSQHSPEAEVCPRPGMWLYHLQYLRLPLILPRCRKTDEHCWHHLACSIPTPVQQNMEADRQTYSDGRQTVDRQMDSRQTGSEQTLTRQVDSGQTDGQQADRQCTDTHQTDRQWTDRWIAGRQAVNRHSLDRQVDRSIADR